MLDLPHRVDILNKDMPDHLSLYAKWNLEIDNEKIFKISHINLQFLMILVRHG
ncbi:hypothetical protein [Lachnobacterium bovis]|uniref:hypothetical protein n=1 Tax=Lachnobacterium bovis TaxID=140626 RepID=UPI0018659DA6|nr:hypothetical protein [Lachnobacterium bovis]